MLLLLLRYSWLVRGVEVRRRLERRERGRRVVLHESRLVTGVTILLWTVLLWMLLPLLVLAPVRLVGVGGELMRGLQLLVSEGRRRVRLQWWSIIAIHAARVRSSRCCVPKVRR